MASLPYSVFCPNFDITSGGIRVMWGLLGWLLAKGQIAQPNTRYSGDFIAIYPEIVQGNPLGATKIIRYILNRPGYMAMNGVPGPSSFDPTDSQYYFSQLFADHKINSFFLPIVDLNTFYVQEKSTRINSCKFIGKGIDTHSTRTEDLFTIDRPFARDQRRLADYLNTCEVMYCFDPCSAMTEIARLCGCRVVMVNNTQYTKEMFSVYEPGMNGISWGEEENNELDAETFRAKYIDLINTFEHNLNQFIKDTQL